MSDLRVEATETPCTKLAFARAVRDSASIVGVDHFHPDAVAIVTAHWALETGWGRACYNWDVGNRKAGENEPHCFRTCGEELRADTVGTVAGEPPLRVVKSYEIAGIPMVSVLADPDHPMCRFASFDTLDAGVEDYLATLRSTFAAAMVPLVKGDAAGYVTSLKAARYFTADLATYRSSFLGCLDMAARFSFAPMLGEQVRDRVVRCCDEAAAFGDLGAHMLRTRYSSFVAAGAPSNEPWLADVRTSCAVVQGAIDAWCLRTGARAGDARHLVGGGMFHGWLGDLSYQHPAWVEAGGSASPAPGDLFYIAANRTSNNNHVGRFLRETSPGVWQTYEGGGGDGTLTHYGSRAIGPHFDSYGRVLIGWWSADRMGYA